LPKTYEGEKTAYSTNVAGKSVYLPAKKLKRDPCLSPCTSINSKWIKELNIRPKTLKFLQERAGNTLEAIGIGKDFLSRTLVQQLREKMYKWDDMKLKSFYTTKEMVCKLKRPPTDWEKIYASYTSDKALITRIYRELKKLHSPKIDEPIKMWATEQNRTFTNEEVKNGQKSYEKMLTIPGHEGNANQNHTKIQPHFC
jgi:hypothetical protein